jgi:23S rRNA (guanosine2251-2'-O)-methyltransferase
MMADRDLVMGGIHATRIALDRAGEDALEIWLKRDRGAQAVDEIETVALQYGIAVHHVDDKTLDKLYGDTHHQGVVLRRRAPRPLAMKAFLDGAAATGRVPLMLVLDSIQDPRNFGACLRVADGAGVDAVMHTRDKSARLTSVVAKAASGAIDTVPMLSVINLASAMAELKDAGMWVTGAAQQGTEDLYAADLSGARALVLGNEGTGLRRLTRERCDALVRIPMYGRLDSLNVATAAAICLFEAQRQRRAGAPT